MVNKQSFPFSSEKRSPRIPFELTINLPKPRYERNIVARDEFIRLIDAIAGLIRENEEGIEYAKKLYKLGLENKTLTAV